MGKTKTKPLTADQKQTKRQQAIRKWVNRQDKIDLDDFVKRFNINIKREKRY